MLSVRRILFVCLSGSMLCLSTVPQGFSQGGFPQLAPFTEVRWKEKTPEVKIDKVWYELLKLDDLEAAKIVEFCNKTYGNKWQKRFGEDLVQVLITMGHKPGATVNLKVRQVDNNKVQLLEKVPMTEANRRAVLTANNANVPKQTTSAKQTPREPQRVQRTHAQKPKEAFQFLQKQIDDILTQKQVQEDLDELEWHLENQYSYLTLKKVDYRNALDAIRSGVKDHTTRQAFTIQITKLLALFGDGHTRINTPTLDQLIPGSYTPFLIGEADEKLVAFHADRRSGFLDEDHPYLKSIDGISMDKWLEAARRIVPQGASQYVRLRSIETLRYLQFLRLELGLKPTNTIQIELESLDGKKVRKMELPVARSRPIYGEWPEGNHRLLKENIGYLRIPSMGDNAMELQDLRQKMSEFRNTKGLIIDVRDNGGGTRDILQLLFPYFMKKDDSPRIVNIAAYRLQKGESPNREEGYLQDRSLYPVTSGIWSKEEHAAIQQFAPKFKSEWQLPEKQFSDWHFMAIKPSTEKEYYHYDCPVIVLMDSGCFSATDIFLGAFKGWRDVTLMGTPSGGGSGRVRPVQLYHSRIALQLSSIASFQPDGTLYDGRGVAPDIEVRAIRTDLIGKTDSILDAAIKRLK